MRRLVRRIPPRGKPDAAWQSLTIAEAITRLLEERRLSLKPNTERNWQRTAKHFARLRPEELADLTPAHLQHYQKQRLETGTARSTIQGEMAIAALAIRRGRPDLDIPILSRRPEEQRQGVALTEEQITALRAAAHDYPDVRLAIEFGLHGMRLGEILALRWSDLSPLTHDEAIIRHGKTAAAARSVPLNDITRELLQHRLTTRTVAPRPDDPIFPARLDPRDHRPDLDRAWRIVRTKAGLDTLHFHDLRHTTITRLCEEGVPDWTIRALVGHVDERMLSIYSHPRKTALRDAIRKLGKKGGETK
jgi:integrase